jgi:hypothetical protein
VLERGARVRVRATGEVGTVAYVRFRPPDYHQIADAAVKLDRRRRQGYVGDRFQPAELEVLWEAGE